MSPFVLALWLISAQMFLNHIFSLPLAFFSPLLVLVIMQAFLYRGGIRRLLFSCFFCGFLADVLSADVFGVFICSYVICGVAASEAATFLYSQNRGVFLMAVLAGVFLNNHIVLFLKTLFFLSAPSFSYGIFFLKTLLEAAGSVVLAYWLQRILPRLTPA